MFSRISIAALLTFTALAVATHPTTTTVTTHPQPTTTTPASQCNTSDLQCCNSVQSSDSDAVAVLKDLLGIAIQGVAVPIGITCSPLSVIGGGSGGCTAQPVCCSNNDFHGVIAIGCSPVNINL